MINLFSAADQRRICELIDGLSDDEATRAVVVALGRMDRVQLETAVGFVAGLLSSGEPGRAAPKLAELCEIAKRGLS